MATTDRATLVDANVLVDILTQDRTWRHRSVDALRQAEETGAIVIDQLVYAELLAGQPYAVDRGLAALRVARVDVPWEAASVAARAFMTYRRAGGVRRSPLPDFYIGAHAEVEGLRLLTRDEQRFRTYFPDVELLVP